MQMEDEISTLVDMNNESCSETMGVVIDEQIGVYCSFYNSFETLTLKLCELRQQRKLKK
jgi:hypothetical protein